MVMIALYAEQQKRHRCIEQSFELWWGWGGGQGGGGVGRMQLKHV